MNGSIALTLTIALPLLISPVIYLIGRLEAERGAKRNPAGWLALLGLLAAAVMWFFAYQAARGGDVTRRMGDVLLHMDGIGLLLSAAALVLGLLVTIFSIPYMAGEEGEEKFYALLTAMIGTIIGLGSTTDLFNLWVWFEAMAITSYMLVAFYRNQAGALEAGVKYLVQSATGSVMVLLGIALVLAETGSLDLAVIRDTAAGGSGLLLAAGALFLIGFGVKAALVPLHTWLPDAHSQAPSGISAMLSGIVIEAGLVAMLRSVGAVSASGTGWGALLLGFGALNMLVGNLMALRQTQVKRLLAYSSLSHMGYMLLGIGFAVAYGVANGAAGALFHLVTHGLMKGMAFLAAGALLYALYIARGQHGSLTLDDLNGAAGRYPLAAVALSAAVLGLGGLPPLAGFMSKWQIFVAGAESGRSAALLLVIFAALNSVLSLGYYAPLVNRMFRLKPSAAVEQGAKTGVLINLPLVVLLLAVVVLGVWPTLLSDMTAQAAHSLLLAFGG